MEKMLALDLAARVTRLLEEQGLRVHQTRKTDVFIPLEDRCKLANQMNAAAFISIHLNTSAAPEVSGIETYYCQSRPMLLARAMARPDQGERSPRQSQRLAQLVQQHACLSTRANDRGARERAYLVVSQTACAAALVECGFLTHAGEAGKLSQEAYRERLAEGIARGTAEFLKIRTRISAPEPSHMASALKVEAFDEP